MPAPAPLDPFSAAAALRRGRLAAIATDAAALAMLFAAWLALWVSLP